MLYRHNHLKVTLKLMTVVAILFMSFAACKKNKAAKQIDKDLYEWAKEMTDATWYKNSDELLEKSAGSGHSMPYLRTWFNSIAAEKLDDEGKVIPGSKFGEGSLIVKELYGNETTIDRYAILYKQSDHVTADDNGWVWGYVDADGEVASPASKKGDACIDCHSQSGNIDYVLMNQFFP